MTIEVVAAGLLAHYAKQDITAERISSVLKAAGCSADEVLISSFVEKVNSMGFETAISKGQSMLCSLGPVSTTPTTASSAVAAVEEEVPAAASEESDDDMGFSLFD